MQKLKSQFAKKGKMFWITLACVFALIFSSVTAGLLLMDKDKSKSVSFDDAPGTGSYVLLDEISTTDESGNVSFDKDKIQLLLDMLSNQENTDFKTIDKLASMQQTAQDIRLNTINKRGDQDIVVTLGGLEWEVVFLSQTKEKEDGTCDCILTLWLSNSTQKAWQNDAGENREDLKTDQGKYYGFANGGLYSEYSAGWRKSEVTDGKADFYPANMYGTSYIRSVVLNNGGVYATSNTALTSEYQKNEKSVFAKFTMQDVTGNFTNFITKPEQVSWQENQSAKMFGFSYNYPNEAWSKDTPDDGFYNSSFNFAEHDHSDEWKNDYIWLASGAETGNSSTYKGLWVLSQSQRANYDAYHSETGLKVGGGTDEGVTDSNYGGASNAYTGTWQRSGDSRYRYADVTYLDRAGAGSSTQYPDLKYAVRPAFHLNLTAVAKSAGIESHVSSDWADYAEDYKDVEGQGTGEKDSPYLISTGGQLAKVAENVNSGTDCDAYFKLTKDIYLGGRRWEPIGNAEHPFVGNFNGGGNEIYGLKVRAKAANQGLFGCTGSGAEIAGITLNGGSVTTSVDGYGGSLIGRMTAAGTVKNCTAISIDVDGVDYVGGLIGYAADGTFSNLISSCDVTGNKYVGGVFGYFNNGKFSDVSFSNIVTGKDYVGGIIGQISKGEVGPISSTCQVYGNDNVGGLIGYNTSATLSKLSHSGEVQGHDNVGGVVGQSLATISELSHTGKITANNNVGGIVGRAQGTLKTLNCKGTILGNQYVGGVVGYLNSGTLTISESDTTIVASSDIGGIAGYCGGTISSCSASCHIKGQSEYGGLVGVLQSGALTDCAGFGSLYGGVAMVGGLVGKNNNRTVTSCSYIGDSDNKNVHPFFGTGTGTYKYCYSIVNQNKYVSTDTSDAGWLTYWGVANSIQTMPSQKGLYWLVSVLQCTAEDIQKCFSDFDLST